MKIFLCKVHFYLYYIIKLSIQSDIKIIRLPEGFYLMLYL